MFDFVHEKKRLVQFVLLLVVITLGLFGVESYRNVDSGSALATVNGEKITQQEFDNALRQQQERMREMMKDTYDATVFDKAEVKHSILDNLISQRVVAQMAHSAGMTISDEQLQQVIASIETFHKDGQFNKQQYESSLAMQNMTPLAFEARVRQELSVRQLTDAYAQNGFTSNTAADMVARLNEQQRMVSVAQIMPDAFLRQAVVDDAAVKSYYDKNAAEFQMPEQARVEYVAFSSGSLQAQVTVDDAELKKFYAEHQPEFGEPEQRQAAHILISVTAQSSEAEKQGAKAKAEQLLQQIRQTPGRFAELARQNSQDPGSAANGGDLGYFARGAMVKVFEDEVFQLKAGEVSGLVQSDYGYHIIKLLAVKAGKMSGFEEVKSFIEQRLKQQKADDKFAELAEKFSNAVYEQSDTLQAAAELVGAQVQQSAWLSKGQPGALPWTDKALQAVFVKDVLQNKRNSAAVEIAPNTLFAARALEYRAPSARPLGEVSEAIRQKLLREQALQLTFKHGKETLAQLRSGAKVNLAWRPAQTITRAQRGNLDNEFVRQVFQANVAHLPAYVGVESAQGGYILGRLDAVKEAPALDDARRARYLQQLRQVSSEELFRAYLADAKKHAEVKIEVAFDTAK